MKIGLIGKTNCGKSTFFSAATLIDVEISNRIFTTIKPNTGIAYVRTKCPCNDLHVTCAPRNSRCVQGTRLVPVELTDVAGLVPDAHTGKGLGNQFLSDALGADALIQIIDLSGSTDINGSPIPAGTHDPQEDIAFLEKEVDYWLLGIIKKSNFSYRVDAKGKQLIELIHKQLTGLGFAYEDVEYAVNTRNIEQKSSDSELLAFLHELRKKAKPMLIAGNKIDTQSAEKNYEKLKNSVMPCSAEAELALRRAGEKGKIKYLPGSADFEIISELSDKEKDVLDYIDKNVLKKYGSTGVQRCIEKTVFELLDMIVVYPVENEHKFSDKKNNVLPDAFLLKRGSTAKDLAYKVHKDIGDHFISAVDCRSGKLVGNKPIANGDVISIKSGK